MAGIAPTEALRCTIRPADWAAMQADVQARWPEEACGLLAGSGLVSAGFWALENALHSPHAFRPPSDALVRALWQIEQAGLSLLAIYHSHSAGPAVPSPRDLAAWAYPDALCLIWARRGQGWVGQAYWVRAGSAQPCQLEPAGK